MIYTPEEVARLKDLEFKIENAKYWLKYWKESKVWDMVAHWNNELLAIMKEYNAALDKHPINQA